MFRDINAISNIYFNTVVLIVSPGVKYLNTFQLQKRIIRQCRFAAGFTDPTQYRSSRTSSAVFPFSLKFVIRLTQNVLLYS